MTESSIHLIEAELGKRSLSEFIKQAWHVVEPGTPYIHGWHIDAICEHLDAVTRGYIHNLLINMPPRHAKSLIVSVFWPVWEWITNPSCKWLYSSYGQSLSTRDSLKCRRLILSPWFQKRYGNSFRLTSDQRAKTRFDNDHLGYRIATSVNGAATGEGGNRIVVDDPHNVTEADSKAVMEGTILWWDETMSTRLNNPKEDAMIIVMQRMRQNDLSGHVLLQGDYEHLCLPAEYEGSKVITSIGWSDPRTEDGELLWPERMDRKSLETQKKRLGHSAAGQLQQRPTDREGGIFKLEWWQYYREAPNFIYKLQSWDTAFKKGEENDYSVCTTWGVTDNAYYLINRYKAKVQYPEALQMMKSLYNAHLPNLVVIEDKASGQSLLQSMKKETRIPLKGIVPDSNKVARANSVSSTIEAGKVFLPEKADWVADYVDNMAVFPNGTHDDDVDSTTQALSELVLYNQAPPAFMRKNYRRN